MSPDPVRTYPSDLPVVALRQTVVFPLTLQPLAVNRTASVDAVNRALAGDRLLFLALQSGDSTEDAEPDDIRRVGTIAAVRQMARAPNGGLHIIVEGLTRARAEVVTKTGASLSATVNPSAEPAERTLEVDAYIRRLQELVERGLSITAGLSQDLRGLVSGIDEPLRLAYLVSSLIDMKAEEKQQILETDSLIVKLQSVATALSREIALLELKSKIESATQEEMTDAQRQYYLRQQLKTIQDELGEGEKTDTQEVRAKIKAANLPEAVETIAVREADRLDRMTPASPEYQMIRTYIDWVLDVPWSMVTEDRLDPVAARAVLDEDHYDLDKVKERIVEYLAVQKLKSQQSQASGLPGVIKGPDPLFRRTSGRRQDVARPVDCPRDEPQVRADLAWRRSRRSGNSRAPPDLHRLDPGPHRPGAQAGGRDEPGVHAGRNRQARPPVSRAIRPPPSSRCSIRRRTIRSAITTSRSTWISRECCSSRPPISSAPCIRRCSTAWRSSRWPATPRKRNCISPCATSCRGSSTSTALPRRPSPSTTTPCGESSATTRAKRASGTSNAKSARWRGRSPRGRRRRRANAPDGRSRRCDSGISRPAAISRRSVVSRVASGRRDWSGLDRSRRRRSVRRSDAPAVGSSRPDSHRPARQCDAGVGARRREPHPIAGRRARRGARLSRQTRSARARSRRCDPERRTVGRRDHGNGDRLGAQESTGAARTWR